MEKKIALACAVAVTAHAETPLKTALLNAVRDAHFERVIDFGAVSYTHLSTALRKTEITGSGNGPARAQ